jgi:hypothetical protein
MAWTRLAPVLGPFWLGHSNVTQSSEPSRQGLIQPLAKFLLPVDDVSIEAFDLLVESKVGAQGLVYMVMGIISQFSPYSLCMRQQVTISTCRDSGSFLAAVSWLLHTLKAEFQAARGTFFRILLELQNRRVISIRKGHLKRNGSSLRRGESHWQIVDSYLM